MLYIFKLKHQMQIYNKIFSAYTFCVIFFKNI